MADLYRKLTAVTTPPLLTAVMSALEIPSPSRLGDTRMAQCNMKEFRGLHLSSAGLVSCAS
jgi:hypothetical protein